MNKYVFSTLTLLATSVIAMDEDEQFEAAMAAQPAGIHRFAAVNHDISMALDIRNINPATSPATLIAAVACEFARNRAADGVDLIRAYIEARRATFDPADIKLTYFEKWYNMFQILNVGEFVWVQPPAFTDIRQIHDILARNNPRLNSNTTGQESLGEIIARVAYRFAVNRKSNGCEALNAYILNERNPAEQTQYAINWYLALQEHNRWINPPDLSAAVWGVREFGERALAPVHLVPAAADLVLQQDPREAANNGAGAVLVAPQPRLIEPEPVPLPKETQSEVNEVKRLFEQGKGGFAMIKLTSILDLPSLTLGQKLKMLKDLQPSVKDVINQDKMTKLIEGINKSIAQLQPPVPSASSKAPQFAGAVSSPAMRKEAKDDLPRGPAPLPSSLASSSSSSAALPKLGIEKDAMHSPLRLSISMRWRPNDTQIQRASKIISDAKLDIKTTPAQKTLKQEFVRKLYLGESEADILIEFFTRIPEAKRVLKKCMANMAHKEKEYTPEHGVKAIQDHFRISEPDAIEIFNNIQQFKPTKAMVGAAGALLQGKTSVAKGAAAPAAPQEKPLSQNEIEQLLQRELSIDIDTAQVILGELFFDEGLSLGIFAYPDQQPDEDE